MKLPHSIQQVIDDKVSGSVSLLKRLIVALENELLDPDLDPATFISYIEHVRYKMEMFTVIRHFCDELILSHNISVKHYPANYLDFMQEYREFWERAPQMLMNNLVRTVNLKGKTVMLHSNSGTIIEVFRLLSKEQPGIKVFQTLSAPAEEGRLQALELAGMGYQVTLIPDALSAEMLRDTDYLLLAADQVRRDTILNKTGSLQMVLAAQQFNVPVIVLTESRKINRTASASPFRDRLRDSSEILKHTRHPNIAAKNFYFEEIPRYLVNEIITEKKRLDPEEQ
jgi:translation initiation factor 2B subunit (eIF-2B alpha/beta/delta family)